MSYHWIDHLIKTIVMNEHKIVLITFYIWIEIKSEDTLYIDREFVLNGLDFKEWAPLWSSKFHSFNLRVSLG